MCRSYIACADSNIYLLGTQFMSNYSETFRISSRDYNFEGLYCIFHFLIFLKYSCALCSIEGLS